MSNISTANCYNELTLSIEDATSPRSSSSGWDSRTKSSVSSVEAEILLWARVMGAWTSSWYREADFEELCFEITPIDSRSYVRYKSSCFILIDSSWRTWRAARCIVWGRHRIRATAAENWIPWALQHFSRLSTIVSLLEALSKVIAFTYEFLAIESVCCSEKNIPDQLDHRVSSYSRHIWPYFHLYALS